MIALIGESLKQWEIGRKVKIKTEQPYNEVHFAQIGDINALVVEPNDNTAAIPNILLQDARKLVVYLVMHTDEGETVQEMAKFDIESRPKPSDYVYTETEIKSYEALEERMALIEKGGASDEVIAAAVKKYLDENGVQGGSTAKIGNVTLLASAWVGENNLYSQVVTVDGVTENSQVDLTPNVEQLAIFHDKDLTFVTENARGVVTVYAVGQKPQNDYTIQVTITEVDYE